MVSNSLMARWQRYNDSRGRFEYKHGTSVRITHGIRNDCYATIDYYTGHRVYVILRDRITRRGITWEAGAKVLQYTEHIERVPDTDATHPDITSVSTTSASVSPVYADVIDILPSSSADNMDDLLARMAYLRIQQQPGSFEDNCRRHLSLIAQHHQRAHG
jgi:hypothetical protein